MKVSVNYEDTDVATALESIIEHPNWKEFVKLLTPMLCGSSEGIQHFFKLMIGNKLPHIIPNSTLCWMEVTKLSYGANQDLLIASDLCVDGNIMVSVFNFRGYHEYSPYVVEYTNILPDGTRKKDTTYTSAEYLEVIEEI
jgi:hypothetical protein